MTMLPQFYEWTKANGDSIAQLTFVTGAAGKAYPYPASALPLNIAKGMPAHGGCYISGYATPESVEGGVKAIGELLVTRPHDKAPVESGKAYMYLIAVDENGNWLPDNIPSDKVEWKHWIPGYAKVQATLRGEVDAAKHEAALAGIGKKLAHEVCGALGGADDFL